ncbi:MAG TPA: iron ABC transporter [Opitutae bacterium]|nr:iron ABC transporter [Opitutae bacterium]
MANTIASLCGTTVYLGKHQALSQVTLAVQAGEVLAITGPNGAGKSTLLRTLAGDFKTNNTVRLGKIDPACTPAAELAQQRAFLEQSTSCTWNFTVREVVALGSNLDQAERALANLHLGSFAQRPLSELSGGEQRMVHFARCLAQLHEPAGKLLLLDEPTSSLDYRRAQLILNSTKIFSKAGGTVVMAVHNLSEAAQSDRVAVLADGRLVAVGKPMEVLTPSVTKQAWGVSISVIRDAAGRVTVTTES